MPIEVYDTGVYPTKPSQSLWDKLWRTNMTYHLPPNLKDEQTICLCAYLEPVFEELKACHIQPGDILRNTENIAQLKSRLNHLSVCLESSQYVQKSVYFKGAFCDEVISVN